MKSVPKTKSKYSTAVSSLALALFLFVTATQVIAQDASTFSREVPNQTITFKTINPYTQAPGSMTIIFDGIFQVSREVGPTGSTVTRIKGGQKGTFTFVPDDSSLATITGKFHFRLGGTPQPESDEINFAFTMNGVGTDGSRVTFVQDERAVITQERAEVSFGKTYPLVIGQN
jgi:hypothetical protein